MDIIAERCYGHHWRGNGRTMEFEIIQKRIKKKNLIFMGTGLLVLTGMGYLRFLTVFSFLFFMGVGGEVM